MAVRTIDAEPGPQQIGENLFGERFRGELAGASAITQRLHERLAAMRVGLGKGDRIQSLGERQACN